MFRGRRQARNAAARASSSAAQRVAETSASFTHTWARRAHARVRVEGGGASQWRVQKSNARGTRARGRPPPRQGGCASSTREQGMTHAPRPRSPRGRTTQQTRGRAAPSRREVGQSRCAGGGEMRGAGGSAAAMPSSSSSPRSAAWWKVSPGGGRGVGAAAGGGGGGGAAAGRRGGGAPAPARRGARRPTCGRTRREVLRGGQVPLAGADLLLGRAPLQQQAARAGSSTHTYTARWSSPRRWTAPRSSWGGGWV